MKKLFVLTVILGSAAAIGLLLPGSGADAAGCVRCVLGGTTSPVWGFGSTCSAAINDATDRASALIPGSCETCQETPIGVGPCDTSCSNVSVCYDPYGQWRVSVQIRYKCYEDLCF